MPNNGNTKLHHVPVEVKHTPAPIQTDQQNWDLVLEQLRAFGVQLLCAGGSGALAKTAVAPLERVKILLQVQHTNLLPSEARYNGFRDAWRRIPLREGGFKAFWRGNSANVIRLIPDIGFKFLVNDQFKIMFSPADGSPPGVAVKLAAGAATGVAKTLLFYPLDVCRTRITADVSAPSARIYPGIWSCLVKTARREGLFGLYRGVTVSMAGVAPYLSVSFTLYDEFKQRLPTDRHSQTQLWYPFLKMFAGAGAAVSAQTLLYPIDTVRRRVQVSGGEGQRPAYRGALDCLVKMVRREGLLSLYRGASVNFAKTMIGAPIQFMSYDLIKSTIQLLDPTTGVTSPL